MVAIPQSGLLAQVSSLRLPLGEKVRIKYHGWTYPKLKIIVQQNSYILGVTFKLICNDNS